jgi:glucosamine kinase
MDRRCVVGLDGGGTFTRALAADLSGRPLAYLETGGSNPQHNPHAEAEARRAIVGVVLEAGRELADVCCLGAGFAGLDDPADHEWAERFTTLPGLDCPRLVVNDAVVAHAGALLSQPGIIAISGTGSIIFGVTESGRHVRNYDFGHYAPTAARGRR